MCAVFRPNSLMSGVSGLYNSTVPIFCSVIKSIDTSSGLDPSCELMDSNGVILANIHREVIQNHGNQLKPGMGGLSIVE